MKRENDVCVDQAHGKSWNQGINIIFRYTMEFPSDGTYERKGNELWQTRKYQTRWCTTHLFFIKITVYYSI